MPPVFQTPLIRLGNLFPRRAVHAKCEFLAPSGCFKIRGATHLLDHLSREGRTRHLVVPSMGNTALGAATGAQAFGFSMTGVVPQTIARAKDEKLRALGVELVKIAGGGSDLLRHATDLARERGGYFVHPHLDPLWTDGYQSIAAEILHALPDCRSLVFPVGGGGLAHGPAGVPAQQPGPGSAVRLRAVQLSEICPFRPRPVQPRSPTGCCWRRPTRRCSRPSRKQGVTIDLVSEADIRTALKDLFETQGLVVEPSSAITLAFVKTHAEELEEPICVVLTGGNIAGEDHRRLMAVS